MEESKKTALGIVRALMPDVESDEEAEDILRSVTFNENALVAWAAARRAKTLWAKLRGIDNPEAWRAVCKRCGTTGQAHWAKRSLLKCRRFKSTR